MNTSAKLAAFAAALAIIFGGAVAAGGAIGPDRGEKDTVMNMDMNTTPTKHEVER